MQRRNRFGNDDGFSSGCTESGVPWTNPRRGQRTARYLGLSSGKWFGLEVII